MTTNVQNWEQYHYFDYENGYDSSEEGEYEYDDERYINYRIAERQRNSDEAAAAAAHAEHVFKIRSCVAVWLATVALYLMTWWLKLPEFMCFMMWFVLFPMVSNLKTLFEWSERSDE